MSGLPKGWTESNLGELGEWSSGGTPSRSRPEYYFGDIPWVKTGDLEDQVLVATPEHISEEGLKHSSAKLFPAGTLLIAMYGATIGKTALLGTAAATNQACAAFVPSGSSKEVVPFLWKFALGRRKQFIAAGQGGAQPNISQTLIKQFPIKLPPLVEQKRIVAKLDALNAKSARARAELTRIETLVTRYKQAVLRMAFSGELTVEWQQVQGLKSWMNAKPEDLFKWSSGKNLPSRNYMKGTVPVIGGNGVSGYHDSSNVETPTIVIGRVGAQCGNVYHSLGPAWITDNAIYAKWISSEVDLRFAVLVYEKADLNKLSGGTGQPYVNQSTLNSIDFPLPSREEQLEIVRRIESAFASIDRLAAEAKRALKLVDKLDAAVLAKAFRGELVQQDEKDEPASVLLERIRAERETAPKAKRGRKKQ